jgi:antitoxin ParD1/3/4
MVRNVPTEAIRMSTIEKISVALPRQMVAEVKNAVEAGEYASSSEVIREALRDWTLKRSVQKQGLEHLRQLWNEAMHDASPGLPVDDMLERLKRKYQAMADNTEHT